MASMPGTRIYGNHLLCNTKAADIYLDEYSCGISVDSNFIESVGTNTSINLNNIEKGKYLQNQFKNNVMNNAMKLKKKEYDPGLRPISEVDKKGIRQFVEKTIVGW